MNKFLNWVAKNSPNILTGLAAGGVVVTAVFASQATLRANEILEDLPKNATTKEKVGEVWKVYIPTVLMGSTTIFSIVMANAINRKHIGILGSAYMLSTEALREYQDSVVEVVGKKKEQEIREKVAAKKLDEHQLSDYKEKIFETSGDTLCYDSFSGRYFKSDIEKIRQAVNELNADLINQDYISLNHFYELIGLPTIKQGYDMGWNMATDGLVRVDYTSVLCDNGKPALVMDYLVGPRFKYDNYN